MKDKNIVIAILAGSLIALAACGSVNQHAGNNAPAETTVEAKAETEAEPAAEQNVGMPNPWHETADLEEAEKGSGVDFDPPVEGALPEGFNLLTYRYTEDIFEAVYQKGEEQLVIRVSTTLGGTELSGDYNKYSKKWEENFKGLVVKCHGDGELSNCSYADLEDIHFAVEYNLGEEGKGLSAEQLKSLFMGMQAIPLAAK
ncbi:MAG: hypothetical protein VZQ82_06230 [Lachnospiraceae bacterium]|nr:hypothetical protein [Lachnospiraceae bacterium]